MAHALAIGAEVGIGRLLEMPRMLLACMWIPVGHCAHCVVGRRAMVVVVRCGDGDGEVWHWSVRVSALHHPADWKVRTCFSIKKLTCLTLKYLARMFFFLALHAKRNLCFDVHICNEALATIRSLVNLIKLKTSYNHR